MIDRIFAYFSTYPTVRYAAISIILISACAALLGICLVLKRYSMIGDGLSHVSFGATSIAIVLGLATPIYVTLPITVLSAILLLRVRSKAKSGGDSAIAMISTAALAIGYLLLNIFGSSSDSASADACATLFGSGILGIDKSDVILCASLAAVTLIVFILLYNRIFSVTFDESFASATGISARLYNTIIAVITAVTIVIAMNMLGALLASALVIFPALSAMQIFKTFKSVTIFAVFTSVLCSAIGITVSLLTASAIGPTVVAANLCIFVIILNV